MALTLYPDPANTIHGAGQDLRAGRTTCVQLVERCLANIDDWEPRVRAWVSIDRDGALAKARQIDADISKHKWRGPLHGIPIAIKDIFDVKGWPTAAGFAPWKDRVAAEDAPVVGRLRDADVIFLGKTVTTQWASFDPPATRNPWNPDRTPGGSSSGSAAAVACGMCLGALASQTGGSITRPASYCGVAGYKPSYGAICLDGIVPLAPSMDHPGCMAGCVRDLSLLFDVMADERAHYRQVLAEKAKPCLGVLRGHFHELADAAMRDAFAAAMDVFKSAGAIIKEVEVPAEFTDILRHHRVLMTAEAAAWHERRLAEQAEHYGPCIRALVEEGLHVPATTYLRAKEMQKELRRKMEDCFRKVLVLAMPATTCPAPDRGTTGDPAFNSPWSFLGLPCVSFPIGWSAGLPVALQLVGAISTFAETPLFSVAEWCEQVIRGAPVGRAADAVE